jgi:dTDP-4-dehydrorhamnose 3,5-epimerase-like enzyme
MERLSPYTSHADPRGSLTGITQDKWGEVNFIETTAHQVRGRHYHKHTRELFFIVSGTINIEIVDVKTGRQSEFQACKGDIFIVEPYEFHTFHTLTDAQWINMLSMAMDPTEPDFHRMSGNSRP